MTLGGGGGGSTTPGGSGSAGPVVNDSGFFTKQTFDKFGSRRAYVINWLTKTR